MQIKHICIFLHEDERRKVSKLESKIRFFSWYIDIDILKCVFWLTVCFLAVLISQGITIKTNSPQYINMRPKVDEM